MRTANIHENREPMEFATMFFDPENTNFAGGQVIATIAGFIALVGAALASVWQRFSLVGVKLEAERLAAAIQECEKRALRFESMLWDLQAKLATAQREADQWRTRYEDLKGSQSKTAQQ
jgi:hypothetical protein